MSSSKMLPAVTGFTSLMVASVSPVTSIGGLGLAWRGLA